MDFGRIVQMIINQLLRRAVNGGIDAAARHLTRRNGAEPDSAEDRQQMQAAKQAAKRARQAVRLTRKL